MILGYRKSDGITDPYWFGQMTGPDATKRDDRKFIRVIAGVSLPILDRMSGAVVVLGETYRASGPVDLTALDAAVGDWPAVENALTQFRRNLKFDHAICDRKEAREILWRVPGLNFGLNEIPFGTDTTPEYAVTEVGRAKVDRLIGEGRLHLERVEAILDQEPEQSRLALQAVVVWAIDVCKAYYAPIRQRPRGNRLLGYEGL